MKKKKKPQIQIGTVLKSKRTGKEYIVVDMDMMQWDIQKYINASLLKLVSSWCFNEGLKYFLTIIPREDYARYRGYRVRESQLKNYEYLWSFMMEDYDITKDDIYRINKSMISEKVYLFGDVARDYDNDSDTMRDETEKVYLFGKATKDYEEDKRDAEN